MLEISLITVIYYTLGNINHKQTFKICGCLIFVRISVQMQMFLMKISSFTAVALNFIIYGVKA
jgi:hypothetical protein